jgi:hypothetical protein
MVFGGLPLVVEEISNAEYIFPYFSAEISWPFSRLQRISHIFSPCVWFAIVVVLFFVTVSSWCLAKQSNDIRSYTTMSSTLYNIWAVTVGVPVTGMPRGLRFRLLFFVFVLYSFAINTVFQTFLTRVLVDPRYENQLTSLDEILNSGMEFCYDESVNTFFTLSQYLRHKEVVERAEICSSKKVCIDRIRETGNFAFFAPVWAVQNYTNIINDHNTFRVLNSDDLEFIFVTTYGQKGSVFLELLNEFVSLYIESGVFHRMVRDSVYMSKATRNTVDVSDGYFVFTLSHLRIAFISSSLVTV